MAFDWPEVTSRYARRGAARRINPARALIFAGEAVDESSSSPIELIALVNKSPAPRAAS